MSFNISGKEFIKVYRKLMQWEWYTDINTKALFIHCLLRANWKAGEWRGVHFDAGEFITSLPSLSEETGLSVRQVRTSLERLKTTGELTDRTTDTVTGKKLSKCRIVTVTNWDNYQGGDRQNDRQNDRQPVNQTTGKRQASDTQTGRQTTAVSEYKEYKEYKEPKKRESARAWGKYGRVILDDDQYQRLVDDYGEPATAAAIERVDRYCQETGKTYNDYELTIRRWGYQEDPKKDQWDDEENAELRRQAIEAIEKRFA